MIDDRTRKQVVNFLRRKALGVSRHYKRLFQPEGALERDAEIVLADLREFCRAQQSTFGPDDRWSARLEGRRDVWLRIVGLLNLDDAEIYKLMEIDDGI